MINAGPIRGAQKKNLAWLIQDGSGVSSGALLRAEDSSRNVIIASATTSSHKMNAGTVPDWHPDSTNE